uniref:Ig-like domain-containing protein n=1 Tax=Spermophilus dauricus TaxID=99837 RepID=A0A8C9QMI2_SPEDA
MQPPSASPCRGGVSWQGILLAVSLLTFWNPHPTAQLTIEPVPFDAAVETDVLLLVHNASQNTIGYYWFKGNTTEDSREIISYSILTQKINTGPAFSGRETLYTNGSLLFMNVTKEDTGFYTLRTLNNELRAILSVVCTEKLPKPNITINNSQPMEGEDSLALTCEPEISYATYLWKINSQTITDGDRLKLSNNNRTLTLFSVTRNDTGPYECETQNPVSASQRTPCLPVGAIAGIVTGVLVGVALVAALGCFLLHTRTGRYPGFPHLIPTQVTPGLRDGGPSSDSGLTPTSPLPRDPPLSPQPPPVHHQLLALGCCLNSSLLCALVTRDLSPQHCPPFLTQQTCDTSCDRVSVKPGTSYSLFPPPEIRGDTVYLRGVLAQVTQSRGEVLRGWGVSSHSFMVTHTPDM